MNLQERLTYLQNRLTAHQLTDIGIPVGQACQTCISMSKAISDLEKQIKEETILRDKLMQCPSCKTCDGQFLKHENGTIVQCTWCYNKFRRIDDNWVFWESPVLFQDDKETPVVPRSKYSRMIGSIGKQVEVDVYDVLKAFNVICPARQHAIKKLLAAGQRGSKSEVQDLTEAINSIKRAVELISPEEKEKAK